MYVGTLCIAFYQHAAVKMLALGLMLVQFNPPFNSAAYWMHIGLCRPPMHATHSVDSSQRASNMLITRLSWLAHMRFLDHGLRHRASPFLHATDIGGTVRRLTARFIVVDVDCKIMLGALGASLPMERRLLGNKLEWVLTR